LNLSAVYQDFLNYLALLRQMQGGAQPLLQSMIRFCSPLDLEPLR
jgi:hypothetical protein